MPWKNWLPKVNRFPLFLGIRLDLLPSFWFGKDVACRAGAKAKFRVMNVEKNVEHPILKPSVVLAGTAKEGGAGPPIGLVDIGVSDNAYLFRVALPGIRKDQSKLKCDIHRDGKVHIRGVLADATILKDTSSVFQMKVQQLCPPGPFTISFNLPGPVDARLFSPTFRPDGILEAVIMKYKYPSTPVDGWRQHS